MLRVWGATSDPARAAEHRVRLLRATIASQCLLPLRWMQRWKSQWRFRWENAGKREVVLWYFPKAPFWAAFSHQRSQAAPGIKVALLSFPSTLGKQMAGCLQAAYWYLEEDPALIGLLAKSLLGPASGKAVTLTRHASNEMGVGSCETQIMWAMWCLWHWDPVLCFVLHPHQYPRVPVLLAQRNPGRCCSCIAGQCQLFPCESWVAAHAWVGGVFKAWIGNGSFTAKLVFNGFDLLLLDFISARRWNFSCVSEPH